MKTYIVQARFAPGDRLSGLGYFLASDATHAVLQAAQSLARQGEEAFEFVATEDSSEKLI